MKNLDKVLGIILTIILTISCEEKPVPPEPEGTLGNITDIEGNIYKTIVIGTQTWMAENLKTTKFNDGTSISQVADSSDWISLTNPGYCWYDNDGINNKAIYGALYNWYAVDTKKICPSGWQVPNDEAFDQLINYLGGDTIAGGELKETGTAHWVFPNTGATDSKNFKSLPGGSRTNNGTFSMLLGFGCYFWSSTKYDEYTAWNRELQFRSKIVIKNTYPFNMGYSVRCIKEKK